MTKKSKLTAEEHADLGVRLAAIRDELSHIHVRLSGAYAQTGPAPLPSRKVVAARKALDEARSMLESALYREHPESAATTVYYPHPEDRIKPTV